MQVIQARQITDKVKEVYGLGYNVYAEIYITPIKNLEWYFEVELGNIGGGANCSTSVNYSGGASALGFSGTTGITWYLPAL